MNPPDYVDITSALLRCVGASAFALAIALLVGCERTDSPAAASPASSKSPADPAPSSEPPVTAPVVKLPMARSISRMPLKDATPVADEQQAAAIVDAQKPNLGLGQDDGLPLTGSTTDELGNTYYQLQQTYKSVPVFGATGVLELEGGKAIAVSGSWFPGLSLNVKPSLTADSALRAALGGSGGESVAEIGFRAPAMLVVFLAPDGPRLAWRGAVEVKASAGEGFSGQVFIDAYDGTLLLKTSDRHEG